MSIADDWNFDYANKLIEHTIKGIKADFNSGADSVLIAGLNSILC